VYREDIEIHTLIKVVISTERSEGEICLTYAISYIEGPQQISLCVRNDALIIYLYLPLMFKGGYVYIVTNKNKTTLYIGVTSNLTGRIYEHKDHKYKNSFSDMYNAELLVYYEAFDSIEAAIEREKQIKKWNRQKKEALINSINPGWMDLYENVLKELL
jgi:putative endonuclease